MRFFDHIQKNNTSGHTGVRWDGRSNKWRAEIFKNGKKKHLGLFEDIGDAIAVRKDAENEIRTVSTTYCAIGAVVSIEYLREHYDYEPISGAFIERWRNKLTGTVYKPDSRKNHDGYLAWTIRGRPYALHRLIWFYVMGEWPDQIDHIDHHGLNNSWENLRNVSSAENGQNQSLAINNKSGVSGVHFHSVKKKWEACLFCNGETHHLGTFTIFEEAVAARKAAEVKYGFHPNHGKPRGAVSLH